MTDNWDGWSADHPDFEGPENDGFGDPIPDHPVGDDYPVEGFGAADSEPELTGEQPGPIGYDGYDDSPRFDPYAEADPYAGPDPVTELPAEVGFGPADPPIGADPDLDPYADTGQWAEPVWAEASGSGLGPPPEPVDGFPWVDPGLLGGPTGAPDVEPAGLAPDPDELADYAGERLPDDGDPWSALAASEDPATSTLARFWAPEER